MNYNSYLRMAIDAIQRADADDVAYSDYNLKQLDKAIEYLFKAKEEIHELKEKYLT